MIAVAGIVAGVVCGLVLAWLAGRYFTDVRIPGALTLMTARRGAGSGGDSRVVDAGGARVARGRHRGVAG